YCAEDPPLGTAGGLRPAAPPLQDRFFLLFGGGFVECDPPRLCADHMSNPPLAPPVVHPNNHPHHSGPVGIGRHGWISAVHLKSRSENDYLPNMVNAGVAVMEHEILSWIPVDTPLDLASDIYPALAGGGHLRAYRSAEYFKDFGTADRLACV